MKYAVSTICSILMLGCACLGYGQEATKLKGPRNAVNLYALGLVMGNAKGNYEHLFGGRHGLVIESAIYTGQQSSGTSFDLQYRYHYFTKEKHNGLNSPFWGPFVYIEESQTKLEDLNTGATYEISTSYAKAGLDWGRRWVWGSGFNICFRIGYGLPLMADYEWSPVEHEQAAQIEALTTVLGGIDGELTLGWAF